MGRNKPVILNGHLQAAEGRIAVGSAPWFAWLGQNKAFVYEGADGRFTARQEMRQGAPYWYAYRRYQGKLRKVYLGKPEHVTQTKLAQAEAKLMGQPSPAADDHPADTTALRPSSGPGPANPSLPVTRLRPPALPHTLVLRPRLTQRMTPPVVLIAAPGGYGKSTLMNEWQRGRDRPAAWVLLDAEDNDPRQFWQVLSAALHLADGRFNLPALTMLDAAAQRPFVIALINEIARITESPGSSNGLALVLDDYHHIQNERIHQDLCFLLDNRPPLFQIIIASHSRPPLALGNLGMRGLITELNADDLRFTVAEGIELLAQRIPGTPLAYRTLVKRTEGWVAGLNLIILSLNNLENVDQFMATFAWQNAYFREFFMEDVLYSQPEHIQRFLLRTSVLKQFNAPLCAAVTGETGGAQILRYLWEENLFITRLAEGQGEWYRYHELFGQALRSQAQKLFPDEIAELHQRAAQWYQDQHAPEDAVRHLLATEAWVEAADLIERVALRELQQSGEDSRLLRWLRQLPQTAVQKHKTLLLAYTRLANVALSPIEVARFMDQIEKGILVKPAVEQSADEREVLVEIGRFREFQMHGHTAGALPPAGTAPFPSAVDGANVDIWGMLDWINEGFRWRTLGRMEQGQAAACRALEMGQAQDNVFVVLLAGGSSAMFAWLQGHLRRSEATANEVLAWVLDHRGTLPSPASIVLLSLAQVCYERNQLARARHLLLQASEVDPSPTSANRPLMTALLLAGIQAAEGHKEAARLTLQEAQALGLEQRSGMLSSADVQAYAALILVRLGDTAAAQQLLADLGEGMPCDLISLARASLLLAQEQFGAAEAVLNDLIDDYPQGLRLRPLLDAQLMLALALFGQQRLNAARQVMATAVRAAAAEGMIRPFLDCDRQIVPLLALVQQTEKLSIASAALVQDVLKELQASHGLASAVSREELFHLAAAAAISQREQEVLQLVGDGLSNRQIAEQLYIAPSTVKTHLKNIYRKLEVNGRAQAVARAQTLALLW